MAAEPSRVGLEWVFPDGRRLPVIAGADDDDSSGSSLLDDDDAGDGGDDGGDDDDAGDGGGGRRQSGTRQSGSRNQDSGGGGADRDLDLREARSALRAELVGMRFGADSERELAGNIGRSMLAAALRDGGDPDEVGARVARQAAEQVRAFRGDVEKRVLKAAKRRGLLKDDANVSVLHGSGRQPPATPTAQTGYDSGAARAAERAKARGRGGSQ